MLPGQWPSLLLQGTVKCCMLLVFAHIPLNLVEPLCLATCGWIVCSMLKARFARKRSVNANKRHDVVCSYFSGNDASFTVRNLPPKCVRCKVCCSPVTVPSAPFHASA